MDISKENNYNMDADNDNNDKIKIYKGSSILLMNIH